MRYVLGLSMPRALERRLAGLCLGIAAALTALLLSGPGVTAVGITVAMVVSAVTERSARTYRSHRPGARRARSTPLVLGLAALGWALMVAVAVVVPADAVIQSSRALHRAGTPTALVAANEHLDLLWPMVMDLLGGGLVGSLIAVRSLRRPDPIDDGSSPESFMRARAIVSEYGEDSLSPFILRPDKRFEFAGDAVVAYQHRP